MPAGVPPEISVPGFMGYLKGKSSLMMFDRHADLKHEFGDRKFWAEDHCVSTASARVAGASVIPLLGDVSPLECSEGINLHHEANTVCSGSASDRPSLRRAETPS